MAKTLTKKSKASDGGSMTLGGHLKELRNRLIVCAVVLFGGCAYFLTVSDKLVNLLASMGNAYGYTFVYLSPQEKLIQYFRLSVIAAVLITIPIALWQLWAFAKPGLKKSESAFFGLVMLFGLGLFGVGVLFAYKVTLPFMLNFLITLSGTDYITASISIENYLNFVILIFIIFGCVFEMPLLSVILAKMGIANPQLMRKGRGIAIVIIFFIAAVITPPDIVSQIMVALPMVLLYEVSIALCIVFYKPKKEADDDEEEEDEDTDED
jgi:sec-independent protein translocase protein TatC